MARARELAVELDGLNRDRKAIEGSMQSQPWQSWRKSGLNRQTDLPWGVSLFQESWHQGVVGIVLPG